MKDFKLIRKSLLTLGMLTASQMISLKGFAEEAPFLDGVGAVNLKFMGQCASDLYYNNKVLLPTEACDLAMRGPEALKSNSPTISKPLSQEKPGTYKGGEAAKFDISYLEPDPSTTVLEKDQANDATRWLWRPGNDASADVIAYKKVEDEQKKNPFYGYYDDLKAMNLKDSGETLEYVSRTEVSSGRYAIIAKKKTDQGEKYFEIRMDVRGHNFLLRKTLLRKIGYVVPNMDRLANVAIKFKSPFDMFDFVQRLNQETLIDPSRWITDKNVNLMTLKNLSEEKQAEVDLKTKEIQDSLTLNLIDVIAIDGMNDRTLNLGRGRLTSDIIQGRRALNSLLVPFSLVDVPESLGLLNNSMCDIFNGELYLSYEFDMNPDGNSVAFNPRYEDARWISRKIVDLKRSDWEQIVKSAKLPDPVSDLMLEKLISRRNCLRTNLNLSKEKFLTADGNLVEKATDEIPVRLDISAGSNLVNGKLTSPGRLNAMKKSKDAKPVAENLTESGEESENEKLERWPGYARHFSGIDGDAPQSKSELMAFAKSQLISNLIRMAVTKFNKNLPQTDTAKKEADRNLDLAVWQFGEFLKTKTAPPIPRKIWSYSKYNIFAYPDRDIIAGAYLGADNQVQIADSLTIGAVLGSNFRREGMPGNVGFRGSAVLNLTQSWVHLKPLASMKVGLKEPLSHMVVPYFENKARKPLDYILTMEDRYKDLQKNIKAEQDSTKKEKLMSDLRDWRNEFQKKKQEFDKNFSTGESIMVTKSIGPDISATLTKGISDIAALYASARLQVIDLYRVNVVRRPKNGSTPEKLQIYFDPTLYGKFRLALGVEAHNIPMVEFSWDAKKGVTYTNFFEFNLDSTMSNGDAPELRNEEYFNTIRAFSAALRGAPIEFFERQQKQTVVEHHFAGQEIGITTVDFAELLKFRLSNFRFLDQETFDKIKYTTPDGRSADYVRASAGTRKGNDYLNLIARVVSEILKKENPNLQISIQDNGDSGSAYKGSATAQNSFVESEVVNGRLNLDNILVATRSTWKGWSKKIADIRKDFNMINTLYGTQIFDFPAFQDTSEIQFYGFNVQVSIYREAVQNILTLQPKKVSAVFDKFGYAKNQLIGEIDKPKEDWATYFNNKVRTLRSAIEEKDAKEASKTLTTLMSVMQSKMSFPGFVELCGGYQNVFIQGQGSGYRVGDQRMNNETGMPTYIAPTYGRIGSKEPSGPLSTVLNATGIANGELFISWLLSPL